MDDVMMMIYNKTLYLLVKILRCEEEVVEWHKVSFQQTHQQHQINPICKLNKKDTQR